MVFEFIFENIHIDRAMDRFEVSFVRNVIDYFLRVAIEFAEALQVPIHPGLFVIAFEFRKVVIRRAFFRIVPEPQCTGPLDNRIGLETCPLGRLGR